MRSGSEIGNVMSVISSVAYLPEWLERSL